MEKRDSLDFGHYYYIYNRGNNSCYVFFETESYNYFLRLYAKYINPIADTYAWCLLKNHFHLMLRIKDKHEIKEAELTYSTLEKPKIIDASKQFSHLFNAYTQGINKRYKRTGNLFETPFERKRVTNEKYFQNLIH
ncbi:transposase [Mariniflexile sp.]|uniref:transposase n=1 Tax=Mariniflexile sp. TaxID=1979402 RepID=UPI004047505F